MMEDEFNFIESARLQVRIRTGAQGIRTSEEEECFHISAAARVTEVTNDVAPIVGTSRNTDSFGGFNQLVAVELGFATQHQLSQAT